MSFSELSVEITRLLSKDEKKKGGIFFTPRGIISKNVKFLKDNGYLQADTKVLEPSCGSCEYVHEINKHNPHSIHAIEYNPTIYNKIKSLENGYSNLQIQNLDFLEYNPDETYDLIIGNPPYFVMKKNEVSNEYYDYFNGRPNIFILFIIKSLNLLSENGVLSFILPKNFLSCSYYNETREYIYKRFNIIRIEECMDERYIDTQQPTIMFIVQKKTPDVNKVFVIESLLPKHTIFNTPENICKLNELYADSKTLKELDFTVSVGSVVWNQCKSPDNGPPTKKFPAILTDDSSKTRLIYSADIKDNNLILSTFKNPQKKNYIDKPGIDDMLLIINRGYGKGEYLFNCCIVDITDKYLLENHVIFVKYTKNIDNSELKEVYTKIIQSFNDSRTKRFIKLYVGNSALNTKELNHILPIYL